MIEAEFYEEIKEKKVNCKLCPRLCIIKNGEFGNCNARKNISGKLYSVVYGKPVAANIDPIEKKPLYHFLPGELSYSIGTSGCNLHCLHCQNWEISQCKPSVFSLDLDPEKVIEIIKESKFKIISYTYTEPTVFYEYMLSIAKIAKKEGIKNTIVSNGFINKEPLKKLSKYLDGANIDLKSIKDSFYRKECKGWIDPILDSLKILKEKEVWLEITNLIIPTLNDKKEEIKQLSDWVKKNLGSSVPLHFNSFYPCYERMDLMSTSLDKVKEARKIALDIGLRYAYAGNILDWETNSTYCPKCGELLIKRMGFKVVENKLENGVCRFCKEKIDGVWN